MLAMKDKTKWKNEQEPLQIHIKIQEYIYFIMNTYFYILLVLFFSSGTSNMKIASISIKENVPKIKTRIGKLKEFTLPQNKEKMTKMKMYHSNISELQR